MSAEEHLEKPPDFLPPKKKIKPDYRPPEQRVEALKACTDLISGMKPTARYSMIVAALAALSLSAEGHVRPVQSEKRHLASSSPEQSRADLSGPLKDAFDAARGLLDPLDHVAAVAQLEHPLASVQTFLQADLSDAIAKVCELKGATPEFRLERLEMLKGFAAELMPLSSQIMAAAKPSIRDAVGPDANPAFAAALIDGFDWPDKSFVKSHYFTGFDVTGLEVDTGIWELKSPSRMQVELDRQTSPSSPFESNSLWNTNLKHILKRKYIGAASPGADPSKLESLQVVYSSSMDQVSKGLAAGPYTFAELDAIFVDRPGPPRHGRWRASERFAVHQGDSVRPCDNLKASGLNSTFVTPEVVNHMPPDWPAAVAREFANVAREDPEWPSEWLFGASSDDEPAAYTSSPARRPEHTVILCVDPDSGEVSGFIPRGLNFGLKSAPVHYCRKPQLVVTTMRRLLACPVESYVDDFCTAEPDFARGPASQDPRPGRTFPGSSQAMLWEVYELLGFRPLAVHKSNLWSTVLESCGIVTDFQGLVSRDEILLSVKPSTKAKAVALVDDALSLDSLSPAYAGSLYGKLRWVLCLGVVGKSACVTINYRQYGGGSTPISGRPEWYLSDELKAAIIFIRRILTEASCAAVYKTSRSALPPALVWGDASWDPHLLNSAEWVKHCAEGQPPVLEHGYGRIGFIVCFPALAAGLVDEYFFADSIVPQRILKKLGELRLQKTYIHPLELIGIVVPYFSVELQERFRGRDVLHFGDNQGMNAAAIKGYSSSLDLARILSAFQIKMADLQVRAWIDYVSTHANIADDPSRGEFSWLLAKGATRVDFVYPPFTAGWGQD